MRTPRSLLMATIVVGLVVVACGSTTITAPVASPAAITPPPPSLPTLSPLAATASPTPVEAALPTWMPTGSMVQPRSGFMATLLPDGRVLVVGGQARRNADVAPIELASAELYDPTTGRWTTTGSMAATRIGHSATLLRDGKVLVAGGPDFEAAQTAGVEIMGRTTAELYDPITGTWTSTGSMTTGRGGHSATLLPDGRVLVAGGGYADEAAAKSAELYDPGSGEWTTTGDMVDARFGHTATLLPDGSVLAVTGVSLGSDPIPLASAELYDPRNGRWTATGSLSEDAFGHTATLLPDGTILAISGGLREAAILERYDPNTGQWTAAASMTGARSGFTVTLLRDGNLLAVGGGHTDGDGGCCVSVSTVEQYDPRSGQWTATASMTEARAGHRAVLLSDGSVLVMGGNGEDGDLGSAEILVP